MLVVVLRGFRFVLVGVFSIVLIVTVLPSYLTRVLSGASRLHTVQFLFGSISIGFLFGFVGFVVGSVLHYSDRFVVVEGGLLLFSSAVLSGRWFVVFVVVFFLDVSFWSVVCFFVGPADGEVTGSSRGLYDFLVGFAIEIGVVCYVFVQHISELLVVKYDSFHFYCPVISG